MSTQEFSLVKMLCFLMIAVVMQQTNALNCQSGYNIVAATGVTKSVANMTCDKSYGNNPACLRARTEGSLGQMGTVVGTAMACYNGDNCTNIQTTCRTLVLDTLKKSQNLLLSTLTAAQLKICNVTCCYSDNCNNKTVAEINSMKNMSSTPGKAMTHQLAATTQPPSTTSGAMISATSPVCSLVAICFVQILRVVVY